MRPPELIPDILDLSQNTGYLQQAIPSGRDHEISQFIKETLDRHLLLRLRRALQEGNARVLRVFAERMAAAAVRTGDHELLRLGLIALLLSWHLPDCRDTLLIFPLFSDAMGKLGLEREQFISSLRAAVGDDLIGPFTAFLDRPAEKKSLKAMGYVEGAGPDGFRYLRTW